MQTNTKRSADPCQRARAIIEINEDGELTIFPICDSDLERAQILDAIQGIAGAHGE